MQIIETVQARSQALRRTILGNSDGLLPPARRRLASLATRMASHPWQLGWPTAACQAVRGYSDGLVQ